MWLFWLLIGLGVGALFAIALRSEPQEDHLLTAIEILTGKVDTLMATQEERLQAISSKIDEVIADLETLKNNNPQIEDEIAAIEAKLSLAQPAPDGGEA